MINLNTTNVKRTEPYLELVNQLAKNSNFEELAKVYNANLDLMRDDVVAYGNVLADLFSSGDFIDAEGDISWEAKSVTISIRSKYNHHMYVTFNTNGKHEFMLSLNTNDIELYDVTLATIIAATKNYNTIQLVTATGEQLQNFYVQTPGEKE